MENSTRGQNRSVERHKVQGNCRDAEEDLIQRIRDYWNVHIHDLEIATHPIGTKEFFEELAAYRFDKLDYLPKVVDFGAYQGQKLLEVGCGIGIDLVRFAVNGAKVTGVDLSDVAIELAKENFKLQGASGDFYTMNGEDLHFDEGTFDVVYAHGVLQYTKDAHQMVKEIFRVLKPGGIATLMVYNRISWLNAMSTLFGVKLEHEDTPVLKKYSIKEFANLLEAFSHTTIIPERFPVKTKLHKGFKAAVYNGMFVAMFNGIPRALTRPFGWHLMAKAVK